LRRCVLEHERSIILEEAHDGIYGGHYASKETTHKILCTGLWWPALHKDMKEYCQPYNICQRVGKPSRRYEMSLNPQVTLKSSDKWVINFVGPINPQERRSGARYIITAIEYLTRWEETTPVIDFIVEVDVWFLFDNVTQGLDVCAY
jgi:hypothetical protein